MNSRKINLTSHRNWTALWHMYGRKKENNVKLKLFTKQSVCQVLLFSLFLPGGASDVNSSRLSRYPAFVSIRSYLAFFNTPYIAIIIPVFPRVGTKDPTTDTWAVSLNFMQTTDVLGGEGRIDISEKPKYEWYRGETGPLTGDVNTLWVPLQAFQIHAARYMFSNL